MADEAFLQAILDNPQDDSPRLIYADWLEERGDPVSQAKAEFLRLTAEIATPGKEERHQRLQQLAAELDTAWLAVVSRLAIENCQGKRREAEARSSRGRGSSFGFGPLKVVKFDFVCNRRWEDLKPTGDRAVRSCDSCKENVHYCDTIIEARRHASAGHCIAVDIGVIRGQDIAHPPRDIGMQSAVLGRPSADDQRRAAQQNTPDAVSTTREGMKRLGLTTEMVEGRRVRYLPFWDRSAIQSIQHGILFVMAFWSGPARQAFAELWRMLVQTDPDRCLELVVVDTDGCPNLRELPELAERLRGNGETAWVRDGKVLHVAWLLSEPEAFEPNTRALLDACRSTLAAKRASR